MRTVAWPRAGPSRLPAAVRARAARRRPRRRLPRPHARPARRLSRRRRLRRPAAPAPSPRAPATRPTASGEFFWDPAAPRAQVCGAPCASTTSPPPPTLRRCRRGRRDPGLGTPQPRGDRVRARPDGGAGLSRRPVRRRPRATAHSSTSTSPTSAGPGSTATAHPRRRCRARRATRRPTASSTTTSPASRCRPTRACASPRRTSSSTPCSSASTCTRTGGSWSRRATWMEEQVADDVNDNRQYLSAGQLGRRTSRSTTPPPTWASTATGSSSSSSPSGTASTRSGRSGSCADAGPGRRDDYSIEAARHFVESRDDTFPEVYAAFARANLTPHRGYDEGSAYRAAPTRRHRSAWDAPVDLARTSASAYPTSRRGRSPSDPRARAAAGTARAAALRRRRPAERRSGLGTGLPAVAAVTTLPIKLKRGEGSRVVKFAGAARCGRSWSCWPTPRPATTAGSAPSSPARASPRDERPAVRPRGDRGPRAP